MSAAVAKDSVAKMVALRRMSELPDLLPVYPINAKAR
jgi:hypothetical protein